MTRIKTLSKANERGFRRRGCEFGRERDTERGYHKTVDSDARIRKRGYSGRVMEEAIPEEEEIMEDDRRGYSETK